MNGLIKDSECSVVLSWILLLTIVLVKTKTILSSSWYHILWIWVISRKLTLFSWLGTLNMSPSPFEFSQKRVSPEEHLHYAGADWYFICFWNGNSLSSKWVRFLGLGWLSEQTDQWLVSPWIILIAAQSIIFLWLRQNNQDCDKVIDHYTMKRDFEGRHEFKSLKVEGSVSIHPMWWGKFH